MPENTAQNSPQRIEHEIITFFNYKAIKYIYKKKKNPNTPIVEPTISKRFT